MQSVRECFSLYPFKKIHGSFIDSQLLFRENLLYSIMN